MANRRAPRFTKRGHFTKSISESKRRVNKFKAKVVENPTASAKVTSFKRVRKNQKGQEF